MQARWKLFFGGDIGPGDQRLYALLADGLIAGRGLSIPDGAKGFAVQGYPFSTGPTAWVPPGYPLFVAACWRAFGRSVLAVELIQCVLGATTVWLIASTTERMFGRRAAVVAAIAAAMLPELVVSVFGLYTEPLYTFLIATALAFLVRADTDDRATVFAAGGVMLGAASLVRPPALAAAIGLSAAIVLQRAASTQRNVAHALALLAGCLAVVIPWGIRNAIETQRFTLTSTEGGYVVWLGNNEEYDGAVRNPDAFGGYPPTGPGLAGNRSTESEVDRAYWDAAIRHIVDSPSRFLLRMPHKMWNMWRPFFVGTSGRHRLAVLATYPVLIVAAVIGLSQHWNRRGARLLAVFLLMMLGVHALATGAIRFRIPLWPALIPFSAVAFDRLLGQRMYPSA